LTGPPALFFRPTKAAEELYDTDADPHELVNLADLPEQRSTLDRMRAAHQKWVEETLDLGLIPEPELHARCDPAPPYVVARQVDSPFPLGEIRETARLASGGRPALPALFRRLGHPDSAVRYWAVTGIAASLNLNLVAANTSATSDLPNDRSDERQQALSRLEERLPDDSPTVRIAAARGLLNEGKNPAALKVLITELASEHDWIRHRAALGLAELGPRAAPAHEALERALEDRNEYVVRLAKRALRDLATP
jgi:HEAT repeats